MITINNTNHELNEWHQGTINRLIKSNHMNSVAYKVTKIEVAGFVGSTAIITIEWGLIGNIYFGQHCIVASIGGRGAIHSERQLF